MAPDVSVTFRALIVAFTDFITVAIHAILYERNIYPRTSFLSTRKYNFAVRQSRHPRVCEWINDAVASVETQLLKCAVNRVAIVVYNKSNVALERFIFDVSTFPTVPETEIDVPLVRGDNDAVEDWSIVDMEEQFRAVISRLSNCAASLQPVPAECSFTVAIELKGSHHHAPISHPQSWIPVAPEAEGALGSSSSPTQATKATPIRAMRAGELTFDAWVEESQAKLSSIVSNSSSQSAASNP